MSNPPGSTTLAWTGYNFDVTPQLASCAGQTSALQLEVPGFYDTRAGNTSSAPALNAAFDNVTLTLTTTPTPDAPTAALCFPALAAILLWRRKR